MSVLPRFIIGLTLIADWLALRDQGISWDSGLVWLLGFPALLGATHFVRRTSLVYLAMAQLVAGSLELSSWAFTWGNPGLAMGWLAVVSASLAILLWLAGTLARRRGVSGFYTEPCITVSILMTASVFAMSVQARLMSVSAYRFGVVALALNAIVTMLVARTLRQAGLTYLAVLHLVTATYLVLFSVGNNDPRMAYVLGMCAVIEAIVFWVLGFGCEALWNAWTRACARPLYHATVVLTILGIPLADHSAMTMLLAAVAFLLTVRSLARAEWLYAVAGALGAACYLRWLSAMTPLGVVAFATGSAFGLWAVGVLIQRSKPAICARLGLRPLDYEHRLFHSSIAAGLLALALRVNLSMYHGVPWTSYAWFSLELSLLAILMLRAYPYRGWVHLGLVFLVWSVVASIAPSLTSACSLAMSGMVVALGLAMLERMARSYEATVCHRLGVIDVGYGGVVRGWASWVFGVAAVLTIGIVLNGMAWAMIGSGMGLVSISRFDWWVLMATIGLIAVYFAIESADPEGWGSMEPEAMLIGLHWVGVLALWWLGVASSPIAGRLFSMAEYYPAVTAMAGLAAVQFGRRYAHADSWLELSWIRDIRSENSTRAMSYQACVLAILAIIFTGGTVALTTIATLTLASITLGFRAATVGSPFVAGMGSMAWAGAFSLAGELAARRLGFQGFELEGTCAASGAIVAAFFLWWLAGGIRNEGMTGKGVSVLDLSEMAIGFPQAIGPGHRRRRLGDRPGGGCRRTRGRESPRSLGSWGTFAGVGVLMLASVLHVLLVPRWRAEWLVYLAQGLILAAYVDFRMAFPMSSSADAAILTFLGFIDLGISEALARLPGARVLRPADALFLARLAALAAASAAGQWRARRGEPLLLIGRGDVLRHRLRPDALEVSRLRGGRLLQRRPLGLLEPDGMDAGGPSPVLSHPGRPLGDPLRGSEPRAGSIHGQRGPIGRPDPDLRLALGADLAVR